MMNRLTIWLAAESLSRVLCVVPISRLNNDVGPCPCTGTSITSAAFANMSFSVCATLVPCGILNPTTQQPDRAVGCVGHPMLDIDWKVHEVVLLDRCLLVLVQQRSLAVEDVVELLFGGIAYDGRGTIRLHRQFTITGYAFQLAGLPVANAEYRLVYSRPGVRS